MTPLHFSYHSAFIISIMGLSLHRTHLISTLLCLESMMLSLFIALSMWPIQLQTSSLMLTPMLMLSFSACEAGMGLSLLVASSRTHGSDQLQNLNLLQC
ncbi:NADH dehydrogenase subunit 4L (mitochondrion) [Chelonia mydas]|uniref:NADH-ubiquinone oxidoreductase chain 4L n=2 Tax=Cheloniidae TaxID=8465 RepID=Q9XPH8_CHEMY|nr:NADH dehydrogenase subunit 4L [Chelonia mydas]YP_006665969.1 NADH dehydrogenase subunit 4L [Natator depressus]AEO16970.1 NADH dehydrogenase subunit 4L [Chelonia mydas]AEW68214.1 NADH dehydrogenase subunit 4L [Chelonia mydas]AEX26973.1 NADH dehydrogenase subunit 4L [Chelonia mydas]AFP52654.1 NADH dehydrogenase subunit 4L [Chelonia mydas]AFP52667.1 NADH dehydrogenase subunit 4L [Chelonia mydas]